MRPGVGAVKKVLSRCSEVEDPGAEPIEYKG